MPNPTYWGTAEPRSRRIPACKIRVCPVQTGQLGGIIVSLTLQSDTEAQAAAPSRRSTLRGVPLLAADSTPVSASASETPSTLVTPGWYADPMGSAKSRWWDGTAWTAELSSETPVEPVADVVPAAATEPAVPAEFVVPAEPAAEAPAAPLSRRQLRELVGPLTTGPVLIEAPVDTAIGPTSIGLVTPSDAASVAQPLPAAAPVTADLRSPFEALFDSSPDERASAESTVFSGTAFLDRTDLSNSSVARPWIGAAAPLVPASAAAPVAVQPAPTALPAGFVAPIAATPAAVAPSTPTFSSGALGFSLPPDPFASPSAAVKASPPPFVSLAPAAAVTGPVLAISARSTTGAVWLFALLPVVHAAAVWLVLGLLDLGGSPVIRYSVLGAPLFLYLVLAIIDGRVLRRRGFVHTASALLALIPPLYLLARAIRVGAAGVVPLLLWLLLQTAAFSFILLQLPAVFALVPLTAPAADTPVVVASGPITNAQRAAELTPSGMAVELSRQTLAKKLTFSSISCPPIPVTLDGTAVSCVGTLASVKMNLNVAIDSTLPNSAFALISEAPAV